MSSVLTEETVHPPFSNSCWAMFWAPARAVLFRTMSGSELASAGAAGVTCAGVVRGRALDGRADRGADAGTLAVTGPVSLLRLSASRALQRDERDRRHPQPDDGQNDADG